MMKLFDQEKWNKYQKSSQKAAVRIAERWMDLMEARLENREHFSDFLIPTYVEATQDEAFSGARLKEVIQIVGETWEYCDTFRRQVELELDMSNLNEPLKAKRPQRDTI